MTVKKRTRAKNSLRRKIGSKSRKNNKTSIIPALIIESMAVVAILVLFFGVRADLKNRSQTERHVEAHKTVPEFAGRDRRVGLLSQPVIQDTEELWRSWSSN